jgi:membrane-associated phospholipid phosphatase
MSGYIDVFRVLTFVIFVLVNASPAFARATSEQILSDWYKLVLQLVRHTPTYSPPVASRSFAYFGVTAHEAMVVTHPELVSLAGQLNGLAVLPKPQGNLDEAVVLQAALAHAAGAYFANTGPSGQRALTKMTEKMAALAAEGVAPEIAAKSEKIGREISEMIFSWSQTDGRAEIANMGFPLVYELKKGPAHWVPTNQLRLQQFPLLPQWGETRTFAMPDGKTCAIAPPPEYSEDKASAFYKEAEEVVRIRSNLSDEQKAIARFWSDDPMLSPTPPGHWVSIALQIAARDKLPADRTAEVLARLGIAVADAFIGCWDAKYQYDLLRPVTYIRRLIDPKWEALLNTPPFPEYPSGHSVQSGAAAAVLTAFFGENFAFEDATHGRDGLAPRKFSSFKSAAEEAAISRLYGGIHFRSGVERGLEQGACIGTHAVKLKLRK